MVKPLFYSTNLSKPSILLIDEFALTVGREQVKKRLLLLLFIAMISTSCVREEILDDIQSKNFRPQLVIHGLISPNDSIFINVGKAIPLGDTVETSKVTGAIVTLSDEQGNAIQLPLIRSSFYTAVYGISQQDFSIKASTTYTLSVKEAGLPEVKARCTVPTVATPLVKVEHTGNSPMPGDGRLQYDVQVSWYSNSSYLHRLYLVSQYQEVTISSDSIINQGTEYRSLDPFHGIVNTDSLFTYQDAFLRDAEYSPPVYRSDSTFYYDLNNTMAVQITYQIAVYLITPDEHMARYLQSQNIFAQNRDALSSDSFIELYRGVIPEYSNTEGGLGVFGAYLRSKPSYLTLE